MAFHNGFSQDLLWLTIEPLHERFWNLSPQAISTSTLRPYDSYQVQLPYLNSVALRFILVSTCLINKLSLSDNVKLMVCDDSYILSGHSLWFKLHNCQLLYKIHMEIIKYKIFKCYYELRSHNTFKSIRSTIVLTFERPK